MKRILTLAIPTYNRGNILDKSLESIVSDLNFDERIEIIISDNCSTDNTSVIADKYVKKYSNVVYVRNEKNIGAEMNICNALLAGTGEYIKLCNDTIKFQKDALGFMLNTIEKNIEFKKPIFFYQNYSNYNNLDCVCLNFNDFLKTVTFTCTWIGNFGIWRNDLEQISPLNRNSYTLLMQVDWAFTLASSKGKAIVYFRNYYDVFTASDKGGYNVFEVFISNYLSFTRKYYHLKFINLLAFEIDKYRLFRHFICIRVVWLAIGYKGITSFNNKNSWRIIFREYAYYPYFYVGLIVGFMFFYSIKIKKGLSDFFVNKFSKTILCNNL